MTATTIALVLIAWSVIGGLVCAKAITEYDMDIWNIPKQALFIFACGPMVWSGALICEALLLKYLIKERIADRVKVSFTRKDIDEYIASRPYTEEGIAGEEPKHDTEDLVEFLEWLMKNKERKKR